MHLIWIFKWKGVIYFEKERGRDFWRKLAREEYCWAFVIDHKALDMQNEECESIILHWRPLSPCPAFNRYLS